jgi:2-desacetyl-2-hydroxyethyl bacteriochlorophyllide A dehydrogenase
MKTIVLDEPGHFRFTDTPAPDAPGASEVLVQVRRIGICGTDMHAFRGRQPYFTYPRILGHELGVTVVAAGDGVTNVRPGDNCAVRPHRVCGTCIACRSDRSNCCTVFRLFGVHEDGGMREQFILPADTLYPSKNLTLEQMALVETLSIGCHAINRGSVTAADTVLIVGVGPIGLGTAQFALAAGARVIVMDVNDYRLAFCRERLGIEHTIDARQDPLKHLQDLTDGDLPTCVFDATGHPPSMGETINYAGSTARIVFLSLVLGDVAINDPEFHRKELTIFASRNSKPSEYVQIIAMLESGAIDTAPWISHRCAFDDMIDQFESWLDPATRVTKTVVSLD